MTPPMDLPTFVPSVPKAPTSSTSTSERLGIRHTRTLAFSPSPSSTTAGATTAYRTLTQPVPQRSETKPFGDGGVGKGTGTVIVLFRSDLRLHDHAALTHALEEAATVIPVYIFDTRQFGISPAGFQRTGKYRARFLLESVQQLRESLEQRGGGLIVRVGLPEKIVPELARQTRAKRVFVHKEINVDEMQVETKLQEALKEFGGELQKFWSNTLYYEDDLPFGVADMPDVYTDYREAVDAKSQIREPLATPERVTELPRGVDVGKMPTLTALGIKDGDKLAPNVSGVGSFMGGEEEALERLRAFAEERRHSASEFDEKKGGVGAAAYTPDFACRISPWLALGCLSPRLIFEEMKKMCKTPAKIKKSYSYYELVWRDFFRCVTAKYSAKRLGSTRESKVAV